MLEDSLGPPIATGRTAEIYRWKLGKVLKLFRNGSGLSLAEREARIARDAHFAGLRVPSVGNIVEVEGRVGLVYDLIEDQTLLSSLAHRPWTLCQAASEFAQLHLAIHQCDALGSPSQRDLLFSRIAEAEPLSEFQRSCVLRRLERLPDGDRLCHGDLHPDNVIMSSEGLVILDWAEATRGNPLADVARTVLVLKVCSTPAGTPNVWMLEAGRWAFLQLYLHYYFGYSTLDQEDLDAWLPVVAAARLADGATEEIPALLRIVDELTRSDAVSSE